MLLILCTSNFKSENSIVRRGLPGTFRLYCSGNCENCCYAKIKQDLEGCLLLMRFLLIYTLRSVQVPQKKADDIRVRVELRKNQKLSILSLEALAMSKFSFPPQILEVTSIKLM